MYRALTGRVTVRGVGSSASVRTVGGRTWCRGPSTRPGQTELSDRSATPVWVAWIEDENIFGTPAWYWSDRPHR